MEEKEIGLGEPSSDVIQPKLVRRARCLMWIAFVLLGVLLMRILLYQTVDYDKFQQKVIDQMTTQSSVLADRGNIYDTNGVALASNVTTYRVFIAPAAIAAAQVEINAQGDDIRLDGMIAEELAEILSVSTEFVLEQTTYTNKLDRTIKKNVDEDTADRLRHKIDEYGWHQFVHLEATSSRYYRYSNLASHVLGFTGSDGTGLYGLESYYNDLLAGTNGKYVIARDARGNEMPYGYEEFIPAEDGYNLNTTLDVFVQSALEEQLKTAYTESSGKNRASGVVMDVNTGAILAMATYPSFNLNNPWSLDLDSDALLQGSGFAVGSDEYSKMRQQLLLKMWSNKAITETYIPGSTFKVLTAAMALEEAVVKCDDHFNCPGYYEVLGQRIHCHKTTGHGSLTFVQGIQQSCNPVLMKVGLKLGIPTFSSYLDAFGYREKTSVDLPGEGKGVINLGTDLDLAIYAFGQNFTVTLMQQITAVSAVANGGYLVTPHFLKSVTDSDGNIIRSYETQVRRQAVSTETCKTVSEILEGGVSGDGGAKNAYVAGFRVAAKTGTSEKKGKECPRCDSDVHVVTSKKCVSCVGEMKIKEIDYEEKYLCDSCAATSELEFMCEICGLRGPAADFPNNEGYVCSTVAYAPADNPQYAVIIIVDEPTSGVLYGSTVAAPYVANVMKTILPYLGVKEEYTEAEMAKKITTVPNCISRSVADARKACEGAGLTVEVIGDEGGVVRGQYPESGTELERAIGRVILYTSRDAEAQTVVVPNVVNMNAVAANQYLINTGLNIRILGTKNYTTGNCTVIAQSIPAGTEVPRGTVVEVTFRHLDDDDFNENQDLNLIQ